MRRTQSTIHPLRFLGICVRHYPHPLSTLRICLLEPQPIQGARHKLPDPRVNRQDGIPLRQHASLNVWSQRLDFIHQRLLIVHKECAGNAFSFKNPPSPTLFASVAELDPSALGVNAKPSGMAGDLCNPVITRSVRQATNIHLTAMQFELPPKDSRLSSPVTSNDRDTSPPNEHWLRVSQAESRMQTLLPPDLGSDLDSGDSQTSHKQNQ